MTNVSVKGHYQETMFGDFIFRNWIIFYDRMKCTSGKISGAMCLKQKRLEALLGISVLHLLP